MSTVSNRQETHRWGLNRGDTWMRTQVANRPQLCAIDTYSISSQHKSKKRRQEQVLRINLWTKQFNWCAELVLRDKFYCYKVIHSAYSLYNISIQIRSFTYYAIRIWCNLLTNEIILQSFRGYWTLLSCLKFNQKCKSWPLHSKIISIISIK